MLTEIGGGVVAALAVHPPGYRLPGVPMTLQGGRVQGRAVAVPGLPRAELVVTLASSADGPVAAVVRVGDGVTVHEAECTDPAQPVADVEIDAEPVAIAPVDLESALATPLLAAAADLVGVAGAALARSVEYAKTRQQFGKPIGAFQGIKHALGRQLRRAGARPWSDLRGGRAARRPGDPGRRGLERRGAGQGGGRRGGGRLRAHRGAGPRRVGADLGARHASLFAACLARRLDAGRQPRALPRSGRRFAGSAA